MGETLKACLVELHIRVASDRYRLCLKLNGLVERRLVLGSRRQVMEWAGLVARRSDAALYVHLQGEVGSAPGALLALAEALSRDGLMVGIAPPPRVCRTTPLPLQCLRAASVGQPPVTPRH